MLAVKYHFEDFRENLYYARASGITNYEANILELEFLSLINYELFVRDDTFETYDNFLMQCKEVMDEGGKISYADFVRLH